MSQTTNPEAGRFNRDPQALRDTAQKAGEQAREAGRDAADKARGVVYEARSQVKSAAGTAKERASSTVENQKENLADSLDDFAHAVHRSGSELEGHQDWLARLVEDGAAELGALADTLRKNDLHSLLNELGSLAERQPALFVGASMAAGVALTRIGRVAVTNPPAARAADTTGRSSPSASSHPSGDARDASSAAEPVRPSDAVRPSEVTHERG